jgi:hypothetical protein
MNAERWKQIDELFDAVWKYRTNGAKIFCLKNVTATRLKHEVLSLLDAQKEADGFYGAFGDERDGERARAESPRESFVCRQGIRRL